MAKYVDFVPNLIAENEVGVLVWRLPSTFSQSQLGDREIGSNACTLITLLMAGKIHQHDIVVWGYADQPLNRLLITSMAEAIVEGNEIHEAMQQNDLLYDLNLTVPEALHGVNFKHPNLKEWSDATTIVNRPMAESLFDTLSIGLFKFHYNQPADMISHSNLYIVLTADGRSVLIVYQPSTSKVTLIDSHNHSSIGFGALVAQVKIFDLHKLCEWFYVINCQSYGLRNVPLYEVAYLYFAR